jgi:hypothetical protein
VNPTTQTCIIAGNFFIDEICADDDWPRELMWLKTFSKHSFAHFLTVPLLYFG